MSNSMRDKQAASSSLTTDILNEPISEGGLAFKFHILTSPSPYRDVARRVLFEALGTRRQIEELAAIAAAIAAEGSAYDSNIIDFKSRKRRPMKPGMLFEIIEDAASGRHASGFAILEVLGTRRQIEQLASAAQRLALAD
jgi:hypothetical protein